MRSRISNFMKRNRQQIEFIIVTLCFVIITRQNTDGVVKSQHEAMNARLVILQANHALVAWTSAVQRAHEYSGDASELSEIRRLDQIANHSLEQLRLSAGSANDLHGLMAALMDRNETPEASNAKSYANFVIKKGDKIAATLNQILWTYHAYQEKALLQSESDLRLFRKLVVYVGGVLSIWLFFRVISFPKPDALETHAVVSNLIPDDDHAEFALPLEDRLTRVSSRHAFEWAAERECYRMLKTDSYLAIALIDVDNLDRVNQMQGFQRGSDVLCHVADIIQEHSDATHVISRYYGDEFAVMMPEYDRSVALRLMESVRANIEQRIPSVTVSTGVASWSLNLQRYEELFVAAQEVQMKVKAFGGR